MEIKKHEVRGAQTTTSYLPTRRKDGEAIYATEWQIRSAARRNVSYRNKFPWKFLLITFGLGALGILIVVVLF